MNPESIAKRLLEGDDAFSAEEYLKSGSEEASTLIYDGPLVDIIIPHNVHTVNDYIVHGSSKWSEDYYNKQAVNPIYIVVVKADNGLDGQLTEDHGSAIVQFEQNAATNQNGGVIPARDIKKWFTEAQWKDVQSGFTQYFQSQIAAKKNAQQAVANLIMIGRTDLAANYSRYLGKVKLPTSTAIETALHMKKLGKRQRNKIARFMKRHPDVDWRENGFYLLFNDWSDTTGFFEHNSRHDFQRVAAEVFGGDLRSTLNVWDSTSSEDAFGITNDKNKNLIRQLLVGRPCVNEDGEEFTMTEEMVFDLDDQELWTVLDSNSEGSTKDIYNQLRYSAVTAEESALESAYERAYQQAVIDAFKAKAGDSVWRPIRKDGKVKHMLAFFIPYATLEEWLNRWKEEYGEDEYDFDGTIHELAERFADRATPPENIDSSDFDSDYYNEDLEQQLHELPAWQPERKAPEPGQEEMKFDDPDAPPRELQKPRTVKVGQPPNEHAYPGIPNDIAHKYKEKVPDARIESLVTGLLEREEPKSAFHKPENFDKVHDGNGWEMWAGANDWEIGHSAACVMFSAGDGLSKRIWMEIKHPNGNDDSQVKHDDQDARVKHGKEAVDTWISIARKLVDTKDEDGISINWEKAFAKALQHEEMAPFVDEHGEDKSHWSKAMIESVDPKDYAMENPPIGFRLQAVHRSGQPIYFLRGSWVKTPEDASVYPSVEAAEEEADRCDPAGGWRKLQDVRVEPVYAKRVAENEDPKDFIEREMPVCHYRIVAEYLGDPVYLCNYDNGWHQDRLGAMLFDSPDDAQKALSTKHRPDWMKKDPVIEPIPRDECTCYAPVGESEIDPKEYVQSEHRLNKKSDGTYSCSCGRWNFTSVGDSGKRAKEEHALHVQGLRESLLTEDIYKRSTTQIDLPEEIGQHIISWGKLNIPDDALCIEEDGGCGRETEQHVTVLYGLKEAQPSDALRQIVETTKPFMIELSGVTIFENEKYDVVKLDVISEELTNLSNAVRKACPNDNKFPDYHGHVTIAYVKPGRGKEFVGQDVFKSAQVARDFWAYEMKFKGAGDSEDPNRVVEVLYFDKTGDPGHEEPGNAEQRFPQADETEKEEEPALAESEDPKELVQSMNCVIVCGKAQYLKAAPDSPWAAEWTFNPREALVMSSVDGQALLDRIQAEDPNHPLAKTARLQSVSESEHIEPKPQRVDLDTLIKQVGDMQRETDAPVDPKEFVSDHPVEFYALKARFAGHPHEVSWYSHAGWRPGKSGRLDAVGFLSFGAASVAAEAERAKRPTAKIEIHPCYDYSDWWDEPHADDPVIGESEEAIDPKEVAQAIDQYVLQYTSRSTGKRYFYKLYDEYKENSPAEGQAPRHAWGWVEQQAKELPGDAKRFFNKREAAKVRQRFQQKDTGNEDLYRVLTVNRRGAKFESEEETIDPKEAAMDILYIVRRHLANEWYWCGADGGVWRGQSGWTKNPDEAMPVTRDFAIQLIDGIVGTTPGVPKNEFSIEPTAKRGLGENEEPVDPKDYANEITLHYVIKVWANNVPLFWNNSTNRWVPHELRATVYPLAQAEMLHRQLSDAYPDYKLEIEPVENEGRAGNAAPIVPNTCPECGSANVGEPDEEGLVDCYNCGIWFDPKNPTNPVMESVDPKEFLAEQTYIVRRGTGPKSTYLHHKPETHNWDWVDDLNEATRLTQREASRLTEYLGFGNARVELAESVDPKEFMQKNVENVDPKEMVAGIKCVIMAGGRQYLKSMPDGPKGISSDFFKTGVVPRQNEWTFRQRDALMIPWHEAEAYLKRARADFDNTVDVRIVPVFKGDPGFRMEGHAPFEDDGLPGEVSSFLRKVRSKRKKAGGKPVL